MLSNFLEDYIKYNIKGKELKFRALTVDNLFKLLNEEREFLLWLFEGIKTENGKILKDNYDFTDYVVSRYPSVMKVIIGLSYVEEEGEKISFKEKIRAIENLSYVIQLEIFNEITKKTFTGVFEDVKKTQTVMQEIKKTFGI
jgi:hypothetical protein